VSGTPVVNLDVTMAELSATALRVKAERDQALRLLKRVLELSSLGKEGPFKADVRAFLVLIGQPGDGRTVVRMDRLRSIEAAIVQVNPDPREAIEIVHALQSSLRYQYDEKSVDVDDALGAACSALEELERTTSTIEAADDAHDLERARAS
jgi:hypothetical protein